MTSQTLTLTLTAADGATKALTIPYPPLGGFPSPFPFPLGGSNVLPETIPFPLT